MNPIRDVRDIYKHEVDTSHLTLSPKTLLREAAGKTGAEKINFIVKELAHSLFAKVQNLLSLVGCGKWINNKSVLNEIDTIVKDLTVHIKSHPEVLEKNAGFLQGAINDMAATCKLLRDCGLDNESIGIVEREIQQFRDGLSASENTPQKVKTDISAPDTRAKVDRETQPPVVKTPHRALPRRKEWKIENKIREPVLKSEKTIEERKVEKEVLILRGKAVSLVNQILRGKVVSLINQAYTYDTNDPHSPRVAIIESLGQWKGAASTENVALIKIRDELKDDSKTLSFKEIESRVAKAIKLLDKGFREADEAEKLDYPQEIKNSIAAIRELLTETKKIIDKK